MAITPADIQAQQFSKAEPGYDPTEVDIFLEQLASEVDAMLAKIVDLKNRLTVAEQQLADAKNNTQLAAPVLAEPQKSGATERQISAALIAAQQTADAIVGEAHENAERIRNEADAKAREVIRQALAEKQTEIEEIDRLKASREEFKSQYLKLIQHFMDDAQNSFPASLMTSVPTGSHTPSTPVAAPVQELPVTPVVDPFAPQANFEVDDLD
ncbi:DivIVA domain-containing protein [Collinsella sp. zg1085]|uniref:DivIVA domain-containing protein n=1 Tax=Collinsella sp. zg1085 TaxID=2844380 RepID=UPI001C0BF4DA|nr:DivIVA domain-containing protein [Collinsella sp. zg1085]QWT18051.1 DivIVA domain-containing protein [Collinsella sp. zg1085]